MELSGFSHVALTVRDIPTSRDFYTQALGLTLLDSSDSYCAMLVGPDTESALILTRHAEGTDEKFDELRPGLDHVSLAVPDLEALQAWRSRLADNGVTADLRRSEWGHHLNFRDPDNIAIELVVLQPDPEVREILERAAAL